MSDLLPKTTTFTAEVIGTVDCTGKPDRRRLVSHDQEGRFGLLEQKGGGLPELITPLVNYSAAVAIAGRVAAGEPVTLTDPKTALVLATALLGIEGLTARASQRSADASAGGQTPAPYGAPAEANT